MLGLVDKGHLGQGADADATLIDERRREVRATFAAGKPIMLDGVVVGSRGTVVTTAAGQRAVRASGLPSRRIDVATTALYRQSGITEQPSPGPAG
jgi:N-acyl-D-aspartate/D-glutamate deacylase